MGVSRPGDARARDLIVHLNAIIDRIDPRRSPIIRNWIREKLTRAYVLGSSEVTRDLRRDLARAAAAGGGSREPPGGPFTTWSAVDQTALAAIIAATDHHFAQAAAQMRSQLGLFVRQCQIPLVMNQRVRNVTVGGIIRGATVREVADDIAAALLGKKITPEMKTRLAQYGYRADMFEKFERVARGELITVGKKTMSVRAYADLVARTQLRECHKVGTVVRCQKNGVDHVQVTRHVMKEPDECTPFAGQVFYIGALPKDPLGFPRLDSTPNSGPPFHCQCRHCLRPWVHRLKTAEKIDSAREAVKAIPRGMFGKSGAEVRAQVGEFSPEEMKEKFPGGFETTTSA